MDVKTLEALEKMRNFLEYQAAENIGVKTDYKDGWRMCGYLCLHKFDEIFWRFD